MGEGTRRPPGAGTIETLPSGRVRVRLRVPGARKDSPTFDTPEEADAFRNAALAELADGNAAPTGALTLRQWGADWLDARETDGAHRGVDKERSVWRRHVMTAPFADWPLADISRAAAHAWLDALGRRRAVAIVAGGSEDDGHKTKRTAHTLSRQTRVHALNLLRRCLADALDRELIAENVVRDIRVPKGASTDEGWTFLSAQEIAQVTGEKVPEPERLLYRVAIYSGLRAGELWALRWADVHLDGDRPHLVVRRSHRGPTKSGKPRHVPLLAPARDALVRWRALCPKSDAGLVFPTATGCQRQPGDDAGWSSRKVRGVPRVGYKDAAGVTRRVRFHDMRHSCASHLVMGTWGAAWSLDEVRAFLGHSSITVTQRYAHLSPEHLHAKAARTPGGSGAGGSTPPPAAGPRVVHGSTGAAANAAESLGMPGGIRTPDPRLRSQIGNPVATPGWVASWTGHGPAVDHDAARAILALAAGGHAVPAALLEALARSVIESLPVAELALGVLAGGPHALSRALELAEAVLVATGADALEASRA